MINHATSPKLYWSYYPHRSRDSLSPVCGIFNQSLLKQKFCWYIGRAYIIQCICTMVPLFSIYNQGTILTFKTVVVVFFFKVNLLLIFLDIRNRYIFRIRTFEEDLTAWKSRQFCPRVPWGLNPSNKGQSQEGRRGKFND